MSEMNWITFYCGAIAGISITIIIGVIVRKIQRQKLRAYQARCYKARFGGIIP